MTDKLRYKLDLQMFASERGFTPPYVGRGGK